MRTIGSLAVLLVLGVGSAWAQVTVPGTSVPWLAGMPAGSTASGGDVAPAQSPVQFTTFAVTPGLVLRFTATGAVCNFGCAGDPPDGGGPFGHGAENGMSDVVAPLNSLLGVFLDASQPNLSAAPGGLDFSTLASRDYLTLSPALKQVFFIGDGLTSGSVRQGIVVPAGATRLFLGTMDGGEWNNNAGSFSVGVFLVDVPGGSNPWLAGMPNGSTANGFDSAPGQSPALVTGLTAGGSFGFSVTGAVSNFPGGCPSSAPGPDGGANISNFPGPENGMANVTAPITALMGVFLDDSQPSLTPPPANLDFSTAASRDYLTLSPLLKQVFFIGNGLTSGGVQQQIIVPAGATRLFFGTMDGQSWIDNCGSYTVTLAGAAGAACARHRVHGHISTTPSHFPGVANVHHGQHGHNAPAISCQPPHVPGHGPSLLPDAGEGLFTTNPIATEPDFVAVVNADGSEGPAQRGTVVQLFGSAEGLYLDEQDQHPAIRFTAPGSPLYRTTRLPEVRVDGLDAEVLFSGLAPGLKGVWQINIRVPEGARAGKQPVAISYEGQELKSVDIAVH